MAFTPYNLGVGKDEFLKAIQSDFANILRSSSIGIQTYFIGRMREAEFFARIMENDGDISPDHLKSLLKNSLSASSSPFSLGQVVDSKGNVLAAYERPIKQVDGDKSDIKVNPPSKVQLFRPENTQGTHISQVYEN